MSIGWSPGFASLSPLSRGGGAQAETAEEPGDQRTAASTASARRALTGSSHDNFVRRRCVRMPSFLKARNSKRMLAARTARRTQTLSATLCLGIIVSGCGGGGGGGSTPPVPTPTPGGKIQHVIIVFQENRSPDNLFRGLPNADTNPAYGLNSQGGEVTLQPIDLEVAFDLGHSHPEFLTEWDNGKLDGWNNEPVTQCNRLQCPPGPQRPYEYVPEAQVQQYWDLAQQYVFGDRMFQTNRGPSFPSHQYIISGTALAAPNYVPYVIEDNPTNGDHTPPGGCSSTRGTLVPLMDPLSGAVEQSVYPCFDHPVLMDLLDARHLAWRYYQPQTPPASGLWTLDAIKHIVDGPDLADISAPNTNILNDISTGNLPAVSWVIPTDAESDHPEGGGLGPSWVATIANAVGSSAYWNSTALIVTWDDWGGWYDHVAPPTRNDDELGFRVPLIVVSAYAKAGYVSHVQYEFGSILKFIEQQLGLGSLGYTDALANDLSDCFDFTQTPRKYQQIQSKYSRSFFLRMPNDTRPIEDE
jgi:phospholipase C